MAAAAILYFLTKLNKSAVYSRLDQHLRCNRVHVFLGPKFTKFLPEPWSLAAGTLLQGLES